MSAISDALKESREALYTTMERDAVVDAAVALIESLPKRLDVDLCVNVGAGCLVKAEKLRALRDAVAAHTKSETTNG